jgi:hypothetical protein
VLQFIILVSLLSALFAYTRTPRLSLSICCYTVQLLLRNGAMHIHKYSLFHRRTLYKESSCAGRTATFSARRRPHSCQRQELTHSRAASPRRSHLRVAPLMPLRRQFISRARTRNTRSTGRSLGRSFMRPALRERKKRDRQLYIHRCFSRHPQRSQKFHISDCVCGGGREWEN